MSKDKKNPFAVRLPKPKGYFLYMANANSVNYVRQDLLPAKDSLLNFLPNLHPDTVQEIRTDSDIVGMMLNDKIEIIFPDGRTITKIPNGRVEQNFCETNLLGYDL